ncbi:chymotrypsin-1-like [Linepithema humile]|uniref:chymotrypsin-1-like n=1 Tax=Linepithema humile TaxID=83485 RepID=UPI00351ED24A
MLFLAVIFVIGVFAQQTFADAPEAIVGGERAAPGEFPWQCSLRVNGQHFCGCSIIGSKEILTAAHCVEGICVSPNKCTIDTGMINVDKGQSHEIHNITIHPRYDGRREASWVNDIAVIILKNAIKFSNVQRPIKLTDKRPTPGTMCTLSGWGDTKAGGPSSKELLKMKQAVVGQDECREAFYGQQPINKSHLCTLNKAGIGACQGDSGGPLICNDKQCGITSWVAACALGMPDIYTSVYDHRDFIEKCAPAV